MYGFLQPIHIYGTNCYKSFFCFECVLYSHYEQVKKWLKLSLGGEWNEAKFFMHEGDYQVLRNHLKNILSRDRFASEDGTYKIRSIYFDNVYDQAVLEKLAGVLKREKFRLRYYNHNPDFIRLEKKSKMVNKRTAAVTKEQVERILRLDVDWMKETKDPLLVEFYIKWKQNLLRPRTIVDYKREVFLYKPGNVRITIDRDVRSGRYSQRFFDSEIPMMSLMNEGNVILEVKYDAYLPDLIKDCIQLNQRRYSAISKYVASRMLEWR